MASASEMDEKHLSEPVQTGVLSSGSSATVLLKDGPPNGGLEAWLQVLGAFFMYFNTWGNSASSIHVSSFPCLAVSHSRCLVSC